MRALTGVMKYIGIVLLASVLIIAFAIGVMHFVPSVSIFGYYFRQSIQSNVVIWNSKNLTEISDIGDTITLNIEAGDYHVEIVPRKSDVIEIRANNNYIGLVKATEVTKENKSTFSQKYIGMGTNETNEQAESAGRVLNPNYVEDVKVAQKICVVYPFITEKTIGTETAKNVFNYVINEPDGLLMRNGTNVVSIYVPVALDSVMKYNVNIKTNNGDVRLHNSIVEGSDNTFESPFYLGSLDIETNKGNGSFEGVATGDDFVTAYENWADKKLVLPELNIKTNGGSFDFTKYEEVVVNGLVNLESEKAKYSFNTLKSYYKENSEDTIYQGGIAINGTNVEFTAKIIYCGVDGFSYKSDTGILKIENLFTGNIPEETVYHQKYKLNDDGEREADGNKTELFVNATTPYENTIFTESAVVELGIVVGKLGLQNEMGSVDINHLCHQATIRTENSNINIKTTGYLPDERTEYTKKQMGVTDVESKTFTETSSLILYSTYGDINVGEYYQDAVIYSKKGHITAYSKFNSIKHFTGAELDYKKLGGMTAYYGTVEIETEGSVENITTWWTTMTEVDSKNVYSGQITDDRILLQLGNGNEGDSKTYYAEDYVGIGYKNTEDNKWYSCKDGNNYTQEITNEIYLAQLNTGVNNSGESQAIYYKQVDDSDVRYYYSDISTKDGTVNFTTDKNPVKIFASDKATINLTVNGVMNTNDVCKVTGIDKATASYMANLNPFRTDGYMYIAETKNGTVNAVLPITSYIVKINCKTTEGSIGATSDFGEYNTDTKERPEVQINSFKEYQAKIKLTGKKAVLDSDV